MSDLAALRQNELGQRLLREALRDGLVEGDRLPELFLARKCGVSRTPVRRALAFLVEHGLARREEGEGYRLAVTPDESHVQALREQQPQETDIRQRILRDYTQRRIGPAVTVSELARRFAVPRSTAQSALEELAVLSVVERSAGQSWIFLSGREAATSARQSLMFRLALESAAIESPTAEFGRRELESLRQMTSDLVALPPHGIDPGLLAEAERDFHMFLARASGNAFIESALKSHLSLLDDLSPPIGVNDHRARQSLTDHLSILENLEAGETDVARDRLRVHLSTIHGPRDWIENAAALPGRAGARP